MKSDLGQSSWKVVPGWGPNGDGLNLLRFAKRLFRTSQSVTLAALMRGDQFELFEVSLFAFML